MAVLDTAFQHLVAPRVARSSPRTDDHDRRSAAASRRRPPRQQGGAGGVVAVRAGHPRVPRPSRPHQDRGGGRHAARESRRRTASHRPARAPAEGRASGGARRRGRRLLPSLRRGSRGRLPRPREQRARRPPPGRQHHHAAVGQVELHGRAPDCVPQATRAVVCRAPRAPTGPEASGSGSCPGRPAACRRSA